MASENDEDFLLNLHVSLFIHDNLWNHRINNEI